MHGGCIGVFGPPMSMNKQEHENMMLSPLRGRKGWSWENMLVERLLIKSFECLWKQGNGVIDGERG